MKEKKIQKEKKQKTNTRKERKQKREKTQRSPISAFINLPVWQHSTQNRGKENKK